MKHKISLGLLMLAVLIKFSWFYQVTDVHSNYLAVVVISTLIYAGIAILLSKKPWMALGFVLLLSGIMEGEVLYFRYFNKYLSFYNLSQAQFVNSVTNVMISLIRWNDWILFLDVLFLGLFISNKNRQNIKKRHVGLIVSVAIIGCVGLSLNGNAFGISVMNQEFFLYHTKDAIEVFHSTLLSEQSVDGVLEMPDEVIEEDTKELTGLIKGKNIITIQVESLQDMMLFKYYDGQEITPFLNRLAKDESFYFSSYYQQLGKGNTSDAEFSSHNSLYPSMEGISYDRYKNTNFKGLPVLLKERGYETMAFHGNEAAFWCRAGAYPKQGLDTFYSLESLEQDELIGMGLSDESLFKQGVSILKNAQSPFYGFFVTITNHNPYEIPREKVSISLREEDQNTLFGRYIESVRYNDEVLAQFYRDLEEEGLLDETVVIIYGDHHGIPCMDQMYKKRVTQFLGYEYDLDEMMNIPLIIHVPGLGTHAVDDHVFDQQDLLPTLVNLLDIEDDLNMMGQDMLNTSDYFTLFQTYMVKGSFIQDDIVFEMSRDGVFENSRAWHRKTKAPIDLSLCKEGYERALREIQISRCLLENDAVIKEE